MTREEYEALPWRDDAAARRWAAENYEALHTLNRASFRRMAEAVMYLQTARTPIGDEILRRCGRTKTELDFLRRDVMHYAAALRRACAERGISIVWGGGR